MLRTGPETLLVQGVPSLAETGGAESMGYGRKFGRAVGIGEMLWGLVFWVNPEKPVSSPVTRGLPGPVEPSGSLNGPNVRCGNGPLGQYPPPPEVSSSP